MSISLKGIQFIEAGKYLDLKITGKLEAHDYDIFVPEIERLIKEHGKISIMLELLDFEGWTAGAVWQDTKFALKHFNDIERIALVGDKIWEKSASYFLKVFTHASVHYFDVSERDEAFVWLVSAVSRSK